MRESYENKISWQKKKLLPFINYLVVITHKE